MRDRYIKGMWATTSANLVASQTLPSVIASLNTLS